MNSLKIIALWLEIVILATLERLGFECNQAWDHAERLHASITPPTENG